VILWTRLTYEEPPEQASVDYEVGTDPALSSVVTSGTAQTGPGRDWTVKVDATGLDPGTTYYYRFSTGDATSIVGRTRTAPAGGVSELRFGVVSCSSYWSGYFNAYGRLADRNSLDLIIHCGDHIYDFPDPQEHRRARHDLFDGEYVDFRRWETLDEARRRYALHYSDPDHLRVHQQHPFTIVWDNHDIGDSGDDTEVTTEEERQAFWEWTPTRPVKPDGSGDPLPASEGYVEPEDNRYVYRRLPYGDLADVIVTDHTQWQSDGRETGSERTLLGAEQFEWLTETMVDSAAAGTDWRLVLNPRYIAPFRAASLPEKLPLLNREELQEDLVYTTSQWDGYPAERERFCERLREHAVDDTIFATGDMHMNWCSDVTEEPIPAAYDAGTGTGERHSVGVSFAPSSVSRGGADETIQGALSGLFPDDILRRVTVGTTRFVEDEIAATNPNVQFIEWVEHGYGIAHVTEEETRLDYWWTPIDRRTPQQEFGAQMRVPRSDDQMRNHAIRVSDPEPTMGTRTDPPAPFPDGLDGF
jgi:alkaline phosphatase D